jgi:SsrA-binding protein
VKLNIGVGLGKKLHDKRQALKEKDMKRESDRILKAWNR